MQASDVARIVRGVVVGRKNAAIAAVREPDRARRDDLTFLFDPSVVTKSRIVVSPVSIVGKTSIVVKDVKQALYLLLRDLSRAGGRRRGKVSPDARIARRARVHPSCEIGAFAVVGEKAVIGAGARVGPGCVVEPRVRIGRHCAIAGRVVLCHDTVIADHVIIGPGTVVGDAGFGYVRMRGYRRIPHVGRVVIHEHVEIGANCAIDRGTIGDTVIGRGTKIDNLVHVAHNVRIGKHCLIMGQCGIAGSSRIGDGAVLCGQVGVSDHVSVGRGTVILAKSAVFKDVPPDRRYSGIPAREHAVALKALARLYHEL